MEESAVHHVQNGIGKKIGHILSLALWLGLSFGLSEASHAAALEQITVSYPGPSPFYIPVEMARQKGLFRDQNFDIKLIVTKSDVDRAALVSGDIDFTLRASSTVLSAARGLPVRMLMVGTMKPFWALVVRPEVNSVKDLKGKVMGVGGLIGAHHLTTKVILKKYNLDPDKDVVFKVVAPGARLPALLSGAMDAGLLDYGEAFRAKNNGMKVLLNAADYHSILSAGIGAHLKKMREQTDQVKRFLKVNVQALKYMHDNRQAVIETIMNWMKVDREMADGIYDLSVNNFTKDGTADDAALKTLVDQQLAEAKVKEVPLSEVADFTLLRQVLKEIR
jgi:ABC-type nitrate/sulfonate/bicarbonate transport system substrate-binding protein